MRSNTSPTALHAVPARLYRRWAILSTMRRSRTSFSLMSLAEGEVSKSGLAVGFGVIFKMTNALDITE